jgi:hypothetical protein
LLLLLVHADPLLGVRGFYGRGKERENKNC